MRHQTQIDPHLARALRDAAEYLQNKVVNLAGIGLSGNRHAGFKTHLRRDLSFQLSDLVLITRKQLQKACACTCRTLAAKQF